jgi:hypothetical protein
MEAAKISKCYVSNKVHGITFQKTITVTVSVLISFSRAGLVFSVHMILVFVCTFLEIVNMLIMWN